MKNLKDIFEGILSDIEDNVYSGDDYVSISKEFDTIKSMVLDVKRWTFDKQTPDRLMEIVIDAPMILKELNLFNVKYNKINLLAWRPYQSAGFRGNMVIRVSDDPEDVFRISIPSSNSKTKEGFITKDLKKIFKNQETLINFIKAGLK